VKMPKKLNAYCPFCKKHTPQTVEEGEKKAGPFLHAHISRQKLRGQWNRKSGKVLQVPGRDKPVKRLNLRYRCNTCKKAHNRPGFRAGKFDLVEG